MIENDTNSYYALVWNTTLDSKKDVILEGDLIHKNTILPKDPKMLYGTNPNDVVKIKKVKEWTEIKYDILTTKQSVKFWTEIEEYTLARDIRIIVWEGDSTLNLPLDKYKVVTPDLFEIIVQTCGRDDYEINSSQFADIDTNLKWEKYRNPKCNLKNKILDNISCNTTDDYNSTNSIIYI